MPVNYLEIQSQISAFCENAKLRMEALGDLRNQAERLLREPGVDLEEAQAIISTEARVNINLRCAIPTKIPFDQIFPKPALDSYIPVLAADGSQIIPSRHRQVEFGAINIAALSMLPGSGQAPLIHVHSKLLDNADLSDKSEMLTEGFIALLRDVAERNLLLETAEKFDPPVVALTDGGLELYREPGATAQYDQMLAEYLIVLEKMSTTGTIPAGYVDKPGSDLVVSLLELIASRRDPTIRLAGLTDRSLFAGILNVSGSRSAIFGIQSPQSQKFSGKLKVHLFYINVGTESSPKIARVEIPGWVAETPELVDALHATIVEQCEISGSTYPYLLHRAHEEAVIRYEDSARLEEMLAAKLTQYQLLPGEKSSKQSMKDLPGKKREKG